MKSQKGITLIALIITIIVMLILVAVSVTVVIQSGLFESAKNAGKKTENAYNTEKDMNQVTIGTNNVNFGDLEQYANDLVHNNT